MTPDFDGETYERERDHARLGKQLRAVRDVMLDARWRTLADISWMLNVGHRKHYTPESSISARLRDLRKPKFGGYTVERRYAGEGLWEYRLIVSPLRKEQK